MVVISYRALPLTVNLRSRAEAALGSRSAPPSTDLTSQWKEVLTYFSRLVNGEDIIFEDWSADYDYENLWDTRVTNGRSGTRYRFVDLGPETSELFLKSRTFWYKRLAPAVQRKIVKDLLQDRQGKLKLKEILHYTDAQIIGLVMGFPELFIRSENPYEFSDRLMTSIISNFVLNFGAKRESRLKKFRKQLRWCMFNKRKFPKAELPRDLTFYSDAVNILNSMCSGNSRQKMYKTMMITQTRASGLASSELCHQTINEFLKEVTVRKEFNPNPELIEAIDIVTTRVAETRKPGLSPMTKISISTSACIENRRRDEGKFGYLRSLVQDWQIPEEDLVLRYDQEPGRLANPIYNIAVLKALGLTDPSADYDENLMAVNVAAIRENGKSRVVTSGSFWKEALLQPFSHMTIEMCKSEPTLSRAFHARKLGWAAVEGFDDIDWLIFNEFEGRNICVYCTDWSKATDAPTHESGRAIMTPLLTKIGVPPELVELLMQVWVGDKELYMGGRRVGFMVNGIPMGDPLTKTNLSLAHPISDEYAKIIYRNEGIPIPLTFGEGNGDDEYLIHEYDPRYINLREEAAMLLGYETSPFDTFTSEDWGFYCEELFYIPQHRWNTAKYSRKFRNVDLLPYLDYPRIRLLIDTEKDRSDFSSSPEGKVTLLGKEIRYLPRNSIQFQYYQLASCFQDVGLSVPKMKIPFLMPYQVYGVGKPPVGYTTDSYKAALSRLPEWKRKLSNQVARELMSGEFNLLNYRGIVRQGERHFDRESSIEIATIPYDDPIKAEVMIKKEQLKLFPPGVIDVLVRNKRLFKERDVAKVYLFNRRLRELKQDLEDVDMFQKITEALDNLDVQDLSDSEISSYLLKWETESFQFKRTIEEDVYPAAHLANLMHSDPIFVDKFPWIEGDAPWYDIFDGTSVNPSAGTSYQNQSDELWDWLVENYEAVLAGEPYEAPPHFIIEDDPIIEIEADTSLSKIVAIVTNDIKLYRRIKNRSYDKVVIRIPCRDWRVTQMRAQLYDFTNRISASGLDDHDNQLLRMIAERHPDIHILLDYGNLEGYDGQSTDGKVDLSTYKFGWGENLPFSVDETDPSLPTRAWAGTRSLLSFKTSALLVQHFAGPEGRDQLRRHRR